MHFCMETFFFPYALTTTSMAAALAAELAMAAAAAAAAVQPSASYQDVGLK